MSTIETSDGKVTAYGFACGYCESDTYGPIHTWFYSEGGVYHVRQYDVEKHVQVFWDTFDYLTEARSLYNKAIKEVLCRA